MESTIKWQKGEPDTPFMMYLVSFKEGGVGICFRRKDYWDVFSDEVTAWCKLSDIEPYKEKEQQL